MLRLKHTIDDVQTLKFFKDNEDEPIFLIEDADWWPGSNEHVVLDGVEYYIVKVKHIPSMYETHIVIVETK